MYKCGGCESTEYIVAFFPTLVKRSYEPEYGTWGSAFSTAEEEREPARLECENCYDSTTDPDAWWDQASTRAFKCPACGYSEATEEGGYCNDCADWNN